MVSKVTVKDARYTGILMGTVQAGVAHGGLDAVRAGDIPKEKANDLGIVYSVWLDPAVLAVPAGEVDHEALFQVNREATAKVIRKAMRNEPSIDWLLANQDQVTHYFHQLGLEGKDLSPAGEGRAGSVPRAGRDLVTGRYRFLEVALGDQSPSAFSHLVCGNGLAPLPVSG
ncbi:MAG: fae [Gemmataceae bacterium]|nr:fae [Gemmataceae bacterium]